MKKRTVQNLYTLSLECPFFGVLTIITIRADDFGHHNRKKLNILNSVT